MTHNTTDDFDLESELNRKALESLSWLSNERDRGAITEEAFQVALKAFDMVCLGLIDEDVSNWVSDARTMGKMNYVYTDKTVLFEEGAVQPRTIIIDLCRASASVKTTVIGRAGSVSSKVNTYEHETDQVRAACEAYLKYINGLLAKNFEVLK